MQNLTKIYLFTLIDFVNSAKVENKLFDDCVCMKVALYERIYKNKIYMEGRNERNKIITGYSVYVLLLNAGAVC